MSYLLLFIEGIITFLSPCLLPMLPIYVSYFMSEGATGSSKRKVLMNSIFFVCGFTLVFLLLNLLTSSISIYYIQNQHWIRLIAGGWVILLGIDFLLDNILLSRVSFSKQSMSNDMNAFLFGIAFSISWTPCVGTFLASVLAQAATSANITVSMFKMLSYCIGLGIPFIISALLIDEIEQSLPRVKKHLPTIQKVGGILLIIIGILMMSGVYDRILRLFI